MSSLTTDNNNNAMEVEDTMAKPKKEKKKKKKDKKKKSSRTPAQKRLMRDFKKITADAPAGISAAPIDMNILKWQAVIFGPEETPWSGGTFKLLIDFAEEYPNKPPTKPRINAF